MHTYTHARAQAPKVHTYMYTYLEVYNDAEYEHSSHEVHEIGEVLSVESFPQSLDFVGPGGKKMEKRDHSTLKLRSWE